ncbi:MAG: hypothetical protein HEQ39_13765 [Rhizobacter sp.]
MKCFGLGFAGALLFALLAAIIGPQYSNYTARARAAEWLALVRPIQAQIEASALKQQSLNGAGSQIAPPDFHPQHKPARFEVRASGEILMLGNEVVLLLTPSLNSTASLASTSQRPVTWRCVGAPLRNVPAACRASVP